MNKKIVITFLGFIIVLAIIFLNNNFQSKDKEEVKNINYLTSNVLKIENDLVTIQDQNNIIYTFFLNDANLKVGDNIEISYLGSLDKNKEFQDNEVNNYKVLESVNGTLPDLFLDDGIFKKYYEKAYKKLENLSMMEKIGQILLVRVPETKQIEDLKKYKFGGYLLFERDFKGKTKEEVINMINKFQENSNIPMLIAVDEEGGKVSRISSNKNLVSTPFKSPKDLYDEGGFDLIREDVINKSKILSNLGINLNLAPVVDVSTNPNDYMYERTIGYSTDIVSRYAREVIDASKNGGVSYTLKHFPGYGNNSDTHLGTSVDTRTLESIRKNDLPPFKSGINAGAEAILVSHNVVSGIDSNNPASLSRSVHNLLRNELDFTGIIITDDLDMNAINSNTKYVDAINAGNDLLIVTDYETAIKEIQNAINNNTISEELIDKMAFRILAFKYYKGLIIDNQK